MVTARGHCYHHSALRIPGEVVQVRLAPLLPRNFAEELNNGRYLIDGVLNDSFVKLVKGKEVPYDTDPADASNPRENEAGWRHAIAVQDGRVLEREFDMSIKWLWLDGSTPCPKRGYMLKVLVVYRITACAGAGCSGCSAKRQRQK